MKNMFQLDNPFMNRISKLFDAILISLLWFLGCLPIVTAAASTNAAYETIQLYLIQDRGKLLKVFWSAYRRNFFSGFFETIIFEICIMPEIVLVVWGNMQNKLPEWFGAFLCAAGIILIAAVQTAIYAFTLMKSTDMSVGKQLLSSFILSVKNELTSLFLLLILLLSLIIIDLIPIIIIILPAIVLWIFGIFLERIADEYSNLINRPKFVVLKNDEIL